jgi:dihydroorotase
MADTASRSSLLIRQARLLDPASGHDGVQDVLIEDGRIARIGARVDVPADEVIDATGLWLLPGLVDIGVPAMAIGNIAQETTAAASGGVSQLAVFPSQVCQLDNTAQLRLLQETAAQSGRTQLLPCAALTRELKGEQLADMQTLAQLGAIAFGNAQRPIHSNLVLKRCLEYAATFDLLVSFCPQDYDLSHNGCAHEGAVASRLGLPGIPASAETLALARTLLLAEETGVRIHIHHLSCARSLDLIRTARSHGVRVSCDVAIHHLLCDESAISQFDSQFHLRPPLRRSADREALLAAVADGTIDAISSQHTPLPVAAKQQPFGSSKPGIAGVETLLPLTLKLVEEGRLPLLRALDAITHAAARSLAIDAGHITAGHAANLCLVDANAQRRPRDHWQSGGRNSPWLDTLLPGAVKLTLSNGTVTWRA